MCALRSEPPHASLRACVHARARQPLPDLGTISRKQTTSATAAPNRVVCWRREITKRTKHRAFAQWMDGAGLTFAREMFYWVDLPQPRTAPHSAAARRAPRVSRQTRHPDELATPLDWRERVKNQMRVAAGVGLLDRGRVDGCGSSAGGAGVRSTMSRPQASTLDATRMLQATSWRAAVAASLRRASVCQAGCMHAG